MVKNEIMHTQGTIQYDFDSARQALTERLSEFKGLVFTEETKNSAKKEVANLRKEKSAFSSRVKEVKAEYMKPYNDFEKKAKELISLYDEPIDYINGQVKEFEENRKREKRKLIARIAEEELSDVSEVISLQSIYNEKWENATFKEKNIREEMKMHATNAAAAVTAIKAMKSPDEEEAISVYRQTHDVSRAIALINERAKVREDAIRREQERKRREEEERIRKEERAKIESEMRHQKELEELENKKQEEIKQAEEAAKNEVIKTLMPDISGEVNTYHYEICLTKDAKERLEMFMDSVGIEWVIK